MTGFSPDAMRRITRTVQARENGVTPGKPVAQPPRLAIGVYEVRITQAVQPAKGTAYGHGRGILQKDSGTAFEDGTEEYPIYNKTENLIAVGTMLTVVTMYGKLFAFVPDKCSNLS